VLPGATVGHRGRGGPSEFRSDRSVAVATGDKLGGLARRGTPPGCLTGHDVDGKKAANNINNEAVDIEPIGPATTEGPDTEEPEELYKKVPKRAEMVRTAPERSGRFPRGGSHKGSEPAS
jgi:hypothetical protein